MVKGADRVISVRSEVCWRVEEDARRALVVAAPVLVGVPSHVVLAVAEAMSICVKLRTSRLFFIRVPILFSILTVRPFMIVITYYNFNLIERQ